jgi:hypothetical protein
MRSLRDLLAHLKREMTKVDAQVHHRLKSDPGSRTLVRLPGVGQVLGAVFVAEIGDVDRFDSAKKLCRWAGLTPKHRESDTMVRRGSITKQGSGPRALGCHRGGGHLPGQGQREAPGRRLPQHASTRPASWWPASWSPSSSTRCARRGPVPPHPRRRSMSLGHGPTRARGTPWPTELGVAVVSD